MASLEDLSVDELLAKARETEASHNLMSSLLKNPATRETMQRALKTLRPDLVIPEIDATDRVRKEIDEERKERQKLEQKLLEREVRDNIKERREGIKAKYRLNDDDIVEVEKLMVDKDNPIPSHDAAARVYLASRTPSTPTPASYQSPTYQMPEKEIWAGGIGNPAKLNKIAMDQAYEAFNEIMAGRRVG